MRTSSSSLPPVPWYSLVDSTPSDESATRARPVRKQYRPWHRQRRAPMSASSKSSAAFDNVLAALTEARDSYVQSAERHANELEVLEGYRYVTQLFSEASELLLEGDPERPRFSSMVS